MRNFGELDCGAAFVRPIGRSVGRSVEQFLFGSIVFAESAPPPHREFGRITGQVDRRKDGRDGGTGGRQISMLYLSRQNSNLNVQYKSRGGVDLTVRL